MAWISSSVYHTIIFLPTGILSLWQGREARVRYVLHGSRRGNSSSVIWEMAKPWAWLTASGRWGKLTKLSFSFRQVAGLTTVYVLVACSLRRGQIDASADPFSRTGSLNT